MKHHHIQRTSFVFFLASIILEAGMRTDKITSEDHSLMMGISLGLILFAIGMNVSIVKKMGIPKREKNISQVLGLVYAIYALVIYVILPV
ncbi:hypothetical protein [Roseivirga sp.]|uniref:hypothetical protein n=1 Tax=Roseivirga sp. TaxID=1964215 RepID=UPI002B277DE3|nr:hypothetical protein [Roseivirga sp.]